MLAKKHGYYSDDIMTQYECDWAIDVHKECYEHPDFMTPWIIGSNSKVKLRVHFTNTKQICQYATTE